MWAKILLLIFVFSFLIRTDHSFDQDLGRHIKLGEIIIQTHQIPKTNLFSYTNPDFPFINTHWLFEVWVAWGSQVFGVWGLLLRKVIIILASVLLILKIIPKEKSVLLLPIGFIFLHVLRERVELRPEIFSFLFTAVTYFVLERFINPSTSSKWIRFIYFLPLIQLIWINTHIYFFIGIILQAIFLIYIGYQSLRLHTGFAKLKTLSLIFILSVLVSLINPNGLAGFLYPLNVTKNYGYTVVENQTMFLLESINFRDPNFLFVKISAGIILLSVLIVILSVAKNLIRSFGLRPQDDMGKAGKNIILALFGLALALLNIRSFPYLVFLSLPAVLQNFGEVKRNALTKTLTIIFGALLIFESYFYLNGNYYKYTDSQHQVGLGYIESGKGALDFVLSHDLPDPIYNNFDIGSYIIYRSYPKYQVFSDGRPEAYPAQYFSGIYIPSQSDYKNFKEIEKLWGFKTIIFSHTDQTPWGQNFLKSVIRDEEWKLVYVDDFMVVLTKPEVVEQKKLTPVDLASLNPSFYNFGNHLSYIRLAVFLINNQYPNGVKFMEKALQIFPNSPFANTVMGNLTSQSIYLERSQNRFFW